MDLLGILNEAIARLPEGDYSPGLAAVMRHISVAMKHFDRRGEGDIDTFTDAVYRTNQAYEGSLKESYRVLTGKDPSKKTPNEIERYLETNRVLRPLVLRQLSRYRQDYRNPSTHDYKLDFDQNEAILAIVSVCAFAKLLTDQIAERLAYCAEAAVPRPRITDRIDDTDPSAFARSVSMVALEYANSIDGDLSYYEFEGGLAGRLTAAGVKILIDKEPSHLKDFNWDIYAEFQSIKLPIETRIVGRQFNNSEAHGIQYLSRGMRNKGWPCGVFFLYGAGDSPYRLYKIQLGESEIYVVARYSAEEIAEIDKGIADEVTVIY